MLQNKLHVFCRSFFRTLRFSDPATEHKIIGL